MFLSAAYAQEKTDDNVAPAIRNASGLQPPIEIEQTQAKDDKKKDPKDLPKLPPTKVEADPKTPPTLQPPVEPPPAPQTPSTPSPSAPSIPANPLTNGGIFGSPNVQGYKADSATSGTKIDTPLINYPGTISVIPRDVIQDQSALTVDDILRNIPSAIKIDYPVNLHDDFILRGFEMGQYNFRWNGFTDPSFVTRDFFNIQRVEVMSGPASVLYGAGDPVGMINFITKQPQSTPSTNFQFIFGSFNMTRYSVDTTGPIDDEGKLLYRLNAFYQQADSFRDFGWSQRTGAAPVIAYMIDTNTVLTFEGSYMDTVRQADTGLIYYNGAIQGPITRSFNEPSDYQHTDDYKALLSLVHKFDDNWTGRIQFFNDDYNFRFKAVIPDVADTATYNNTVVPGYNAAVGFPLLAPLGPTQILRQLNEGYTSEQFYNLRAELAGKYDGLFFKNSAVVGAEVAWYHSNNTYFLSDPGQPSQLFGGTFPTVPPAYVFNYAHPVYNQTNGLVALPNDFAELDQVRYGLYASDMIELTERLKLLVGVRYDIVNTSFANSYSSTTFGFPFGFPTTEENRIDYHTSPRVGLVYQPIPETLSFYATYTTSFDPPISGIFAVPTTILPEIGQSGEIGMKLDLFEKKLSLQAAGYIIDKRNVTTLENFAQSVQLGEVRSSGAELSAVGKITRNLSVIANYAYCDSRIVSDPGDQAILGNLAGVPFRGVPHNNANVWLRYNLIDNEIHTLGVGAGLVYVGERPGDLQADFYLPGYTRVDAGLFYKRGQFNASVYLENLGNSTYYSGSYDANTITPGAPINFRFMMGYTF
jgi:iron complex outermembrane receptor protein